MYIAFKKKSYDAQIVKIVFFAHKIKKYAFLFLVQLVKSFHDKL